MEQPTITLTDLINRFVEYKGYENLSPLSINVLNELIGYAVR